MAGLHNSLATYSSLDTYTTCGELLKFLRRRVHLSQRELSIAVGYSESHISRIENNERPVDRMSVLALFVPALHLEEEPEVVNRLLALCAEQPTTANGESASPAPPPTILPSSVHTQSVATACPPELRSLSVPLTSFIGRTEEVAEVSDLLHRQQVRLLTLTGAGGCGKTRLARHVGEMLRPAYSQGVWWVELAALTEPALLPNVVATALAMDKAAADATLAQLTDFLHGRQMLLILDNCEHLIEGVAPLAARLLQACPQLQILATSREALAVSGELNYGVHPLALPPAQRGAALLAAAVAGYDAIQLFVERARTARYTFTLTDQNAPAVARICHRLDGIPLGIELAAAWVNLLSPAQIADRLEQDFDLLVADKRLVLPRHQTLRAAIDWSYNLLNATERQLLRWLAVFVGGWHLAAAEAVVAAMVREQGMPAKYQVVRLLNQLVNKSLVVVEHGAEGEAPGVPRARLLEPLREYLLAELVQAGEEQQLRDCHLRYFVILAEAVDAEWTAEAPQVGLARLACEEENLRAALGWSLTAQKAEAGVRLACALARFWRQRGHYNEGRRWLQATLAQAPAASSVQSQALLWLGTFARLQGDMVEAQRLCEESLRLTDARGDALGTAVALENLGWSYVRSDHGRAIDYFQASLACFRTLGCLRQSGRLLTTLAQMAREEGAFEQARVQLHDALTLARTVDDPQGIAQALNGLSELASLAGEYERAGHLLAESLVLATTSGNEQDLAWVHCGLAENCWQRGDFASAQQHGEISQRLFQSLGSVTGQAIALHHLGLIGLTTGNLGQAVHCLHKSLHLCQTAQHTFMAARCLAGLAGVALRWGMAAPAAQVLATAGACFATHPRQLTPADEAFYQQLVTECRTHLGEAAFTTAWTAGAAKSVTDWNVCALASAV